MCYPQLPDKKTQKPPANTIPFLTLFFYRKKIRLSAKKSFALFFIFFSVLLFVYSLPAYAEEIISADILEIDIFLQTILEVGILVIFAYFIYFGRKWNKGEISILDNDSIKRAVAHVVGIYGFFGSVWIFLSDTILGWVVQNQTVLIQIAILKGSLFIITTATLLYFLFYRNLYRYRKSELALKDSEKRYRNMIEIAPDAIFTLNHEGIFQTINPAGCRLLGYTKKELEGSSIEITYATEEVSNMRERLKQLAQNKTLRFERQMVRKDGVHIFVDVVTSPIGESSYQAFARDITEQKTNERNIIESRENLSVALNSIGDAVIVTDTTGIITRINNAAERLLDLSYNDTVGKPLNSIFNIINNETGMPAENPVEQVVKSGKTVDLANHTALILHNGTVRQIADSASPIHGKNNELTGVIIVCRDVTETYAKDKVIRESELRFHTLFMEMNEGCALHTIIYDDKKIPVNYRILDVNPQYESIIGVNRNDVISKTATEVYKTAVAPFLSECIVACNSKKSFSFETFFLPLEKYFHISIAPLGLDSFATIFFDITDQKRNEAKIKMQDERMTENIKELQIEQEKLIRLTIDLDKFKKAVENVSEQVVICNPAGKIIYCNKATETITGHSQDEFLEKHIFTVRSSPDKNQLAQLLSHIEGSKEHWTGDARFLRKNGEIYIADISISPISDANGTVLFYVIVERDITKAREVERAKTEFVFLASHQLKAPLTIISWYLETLTSENFGELDEKHRKYFDEINTANNRMKKLVGDLLNVARIDMDTLGLHNKKTNVNEIYCSVVKEIEPLTAKKEITITAKCPAESLDFILDPDLFRIIIQNLIMNAVKYTPQKGSVVFSLTCKDDTLLVDITDTGYGIPAKDVNHIFSKFFRADNIRLIEAEGTGLGLYIAKSFIEKMKGSITFESKENVGTSFHVAIPAAQEKN